MSSYPTVRRIGDPVIPPGFARLRIRSFGDPCETSITVVDSDGRELKLLGAIAASWAMTPTPEPTQTMVLVHEADVDVQSDSVEIARTK